MGFIYGKTDTWTITMSKTENKVQCHNVKMALLMTNSLLSEFVFYGFIYLEAYLRCLYLWIALEIQEQSILMQGIYQNVYAQSLWNAEAIALFSFLYFEQQLSKKVFSSWVTSSYISIHRIIASISATFSSIEKLN